VKCEDCEKVFEKIMKAEVLEVPCKFCDGTAHKQVSAPAYVYGDFYDQGKRELHKAKEEVEKKYGSSGINIV